MTIAEVILWMSIGLIVYTYFVYVGILYVLAGSRRSPANLSPGSAFPRVSIVFSAFNEGGTLPAKVENLKAVDYPEQNVEVIAGSDGSTDETGAVLQAATGPKFRSFRFSERRGKAAVLNDLVAAAQGEIVVFTDANTMFAPDTVKNLVRPFEDPRVGAVCGNLVLRSDDKIVGGIGESAYWKYENVIKRLESEYKTVFGGTGAVYAIRRALFRPLPTATPVTDDLVIPLRILASGYLTKYESKALAYEESETSVLREFKRKTRIGAQNFSSLREFAGLLNPRAGFIAFGLWSHKVIRWLVPFFMLAAFVSTVVLSGSSTGYYDLLLAEILFIVLGVVGLGLEMNRRRSGILGIPYYVLATNAALFMGFVRCVLNLERPMWEVNRG